MALVVVTPQITPAFTHSPSTLVAATNNISAVVGLNCSEIATLLLSCRSDSLGPKLARRSAALGVTQTLLRSQQASKQIDVQECQAIGSLSDAAISDRALR